MPRLITFGLFIVVVSGAARHGYAADVGAPDFPGSIDKVRVEVLYERYDRDAELSDIDITITGPGGTISDTAPGGSGAQEEQRFLARLNVLAGDTLVAFFDGGMTDSKDSTGPAAIVGGGLRALVYDHDSVVTNVFGSLYYVPEIQYESSVVDSAFGPGTSTQQETYWEASLGVNLSRSFPMEHGGTLTPYGGAIISILRGDEDFETQFPSAGLTFQGDATFKEDGMVSLFAGFVIKASKRVGIRIEGRFVNQTSLSAALSVNL